MPSSVTSLFWISLCAVIAPLLAGLVPRKLVPEVVLLLVMGVLIGPFALDLAATDEAIDMLQQLGLGMLFLLAGYEIDLKELTGRGGQRAAATWLAGIMLAFVVLSLVGLTQVIDDEAALAIAMTSTSLGTLLPILRDSGMLASPVGAAVLRHGAYGELGPIAAMAILLGARGPVASLVVLAIFAMIAVVASLPLHRLRSEGSQVLELIRLGSETTGQTTVRLTMLLLVGLIAVASALELDTVLGAFAAGFILRRALPGGDERLEAKLDGLAFGLLIPIFFVASGMAIDPSALAAEPDDLVIFVLMILMVRGGPIYLATSRDSGASSGELDKRQSLRVALYGSAGLPIIVAVTTIAVHSGEMSRTNASVLVAAGAVTVLLFPLTATALAGSPTAATSPANRVDSVD